MKIKFGCISYINSLPYKIPLSSNKNILLISEVPTKLFSLFSQNKLDAVITSSSYSFISKKKNFLPFFGIGANDSILSVNLYAHPNLFEKKKPIIKVTNESSTSFLLLKILCKFHWDITPNFIISPSNINTISKNCDGFLLIGNDALFYPHLKDFLTFDLAKEWFYFSNLPFTFALCYIQNEFQKYKSSIETILTQSLDWSNKNKDYIIKFAHKSSKLQKQLLQKYFQLCIYNLSKKHLEGLLKFQDLYDQL